MATRLTGRIPPGGLIPLLLAATSIFPAAAKAQGETGWAGWQNLGNVYSPEPRAPAFRLSTAVFFNGNPMIVTVDPSGEWMTAIESRRGIWIRWITVHHPPRISPYFAMTTNATPQPILFYRGNDREVGFTEVTHPGLGAVNWTQWTMPQSLGRPRDAIPDLIHAVRLSDRRIGVCFVDLPTSTVRCRVRHAEGAWDPWSSSARAPEAIGLQLTARLDAERRIHFFAASGSTLFELPQGGRSVMGGAWRTIGTLPGGLRLAVPMAALNADGRMEVFARGSDEALWHIYQQPGTASGWSPWESLGRPPGVSLPFLFATDAAAENSDGRLEVFVVAGDGNVWHIYQNQPNCCWSDWQSLGQATWLSRPVSLITELRVVKRRGNRLELFGLDQQGRLWTNSQH